MGLGVAIGLGVGVVVAIVAVVLAVRVSGGSSASSDPSSSTTSVAGAPVSRLPVNRNAPGSVAGKPCVPASDVPTAAGKPSVDVPTGPPPSELVTKDIEVGSGAEVHAGEKVTVHYLGVACSSGRQFDASWDRNQAFVFTLGAGEVIAGWDQGLAGMKVGGRRLLVIPPELAYGDRPPDNQIGPGETLVFLVHLEDVKVQ